MNWQLFFQKNTHLESFEITQSHYCCMDERTGIVYLSLALLYYQSFRNRPQGYRKARFQAFLGSNGVLPVKSLIQASFREHICLYPIGLDPLTPLCRFTLPFPAPACLAFLHPFVQQDPDHSRALPTSHLVFFLAYPPKTPFVLFGVQNIVLSSLHLMEPDLLLVIAPHWHPE